MITIIILVELLAVYSKQPQLALKLRRLVAALAALPGVTSAGAEVSSTPARCPHRVAQRLDPDALAALVAAYTAGATATELAKRYELSRSAVCAAVMNTGVALRVRGLEDTQAAEAVQLYRKGWSLARLGERYDVDDMTVRRRLLAAEVVMRGAHERRMPGKFT